MQEWESAYLAGFIDGDGCLTVHKQKRSRKDQNFTYYFRVNMQVANRHLGVLQWMQKVTKCPGSLYKRNLNRKNPSWSDAWSLRWNSKQMYTILKQIRPYMIMKGRHADLIMEMIELKRGTLDLMKVKQQKSCKLMTKDYLTKLDRYEDIYQIIKKLNKTGQEYITNNRVNSGKLHHTMDNPEPKPTRPCRKVQRSDGSESVPYNTSLAPDTKVKI